MSETPKNDGIWIVTDEMPQISIPDGGKGGSSNTRSWGEETIREPTGSKGVGVAVTAFAAVMRYSSNK
ncbi:hypothetical protein ACEYW6_16990 [Nostoc sp. UIC 10607]